VLTIWICVALTGLASFAIKATGPAILGTRPLPSRARGVIALLAPALLAGLVISDILGPNWSSADGPLALGVVTAAASRTTGLPTPACIIAVVVVTAVARAAL
jgi:branched-subunit amino acid transport protein